MEELRSKYSAEVLEEDQAEAEREARLRLVKDILEKNDFDPAPSMIDREVAAQVDMYRRQLASQGLTFEAIGANPASMSGQMRPQATFNVKAFLLLDAIGKKEEIDVTDEELDAEIKEMAKERLKETVRKAAEEASKSNGWGSVSSSVRKDVMKMLETKVDWRKVPRFFVKSSQRADRSSSIKRINRRYAYVHPGRKANRVAKLAVSIDQSGSVSDEMLSLFFAELNKLSAIAEFVVIPFDTQVDESLVYTWK